MTRLCSRVSWLRPGFLCAAAIRLAADTPYLPPPHRLVSAVCDFADPLVQTTGDSARVAVAGCETLHRIGAPLLPFRTVRLLLPPGTRVQDVTAQTLDEPAILPGTWRVDHGRLPRTSAHRAQPIAEGDEFDGPDPSVYGSDDLYPAARAELASIQRLSGHEIAFVRVYPVQYAPASGQLMSARQVRLTLVLAALPPEAAEWPQATPVAPRARNAARARVAALVENPAMLDAYPRPRSAELQSQPAGADYLLITRGNLVSAFQPLLTAKSQSGLGVKVETVETITATFPGRDLPEQIRNYIRHAYTTWGVTDVLLGGDVATVPCRYAYVPMGSLVPNPPLVPADLYYACLDGSWNSDSDTRWGEPDDGEGGGDVDLLSEVFVGRAPVDTAAETQIFVEKTLRYSTESHPRPADVVFLAEVLGQTPGGLAQGGAMFDPLIPLFADYRIAWLDDRFTEPPWTRADALAAVNQNPHLVLFNGHGNDFTLIGLEHFATRAIETPDLDAFVNAWPFLALSVGCNVGQFDNDRFSPDSVGEELVKRHNRGAFAAILNSRLGWYDPQDEAKYSGEFQRQFFHQLLQQDQLRLGAACQLGKQDLVGHLETSGIMTYRWCYYEITLLGDPHAAWQPPPQIPPDVDADSDGMFDWQEDIAGTDPSDPASVLAVRVQSLGPGTGARLEWPSAANRTYAVWGATESVPGEFGLLADNLTATPPMNVFLDDRPGVAARFYRVTARR